MIKLRPVGAFAIVVVVMALILTAKLVASGRLGGHDHELVRPGADGIVRVPVGDLARGDARFYRFLNAGNQEVKFFVARDSAGTLQVAFNAGDSHYKLRRGFSVQDGFVIDNKCGTTNRLEDINQGGSGCKPVPLKHTVAGDQLVLRENDLLEGWRYFR